MARTLTAAVLTLALAAGACGGGSTDDGVASVDDLAESSLEVADATTTTAVSDEEQALGFAQCMRDSGYPDFPDPQVGDDGSLDLLGGGGLAQFQNADQEDLEAALDACADLLEGIALSPASLGFDITDFQDTLLQFAICMRDNGYEIQDPDFSSLGAQDESGEFINPFGDIDPEDPDFQAALEECQDVFQTLDFGGNG